MTGIRVIREADIEVLNSDSGSGLVRERILETDDVLWMRTRAEGGTVTDWHSHGDRDTYAYVFSGRLVVEYGPDGGERVEVATGEFLRLHAGTDHRTVNPDDEPFVAVSLLVGDGPTTVRASGAPSADASVPGVEVVDQSSLEPTEETPGFDRTTAFETDEIFFLRSSVESEDTSAWHHHEDRDVYSFMIEGRARIEYGPNGEEAVEVDTGEFLTIPGSTVHRDVNPEPTRQTAIAGFVGDGPLVVNVDGPDGEQP